MDDRTLYATILGIGRPWDVVRVELDDAAKTVHVWLAEDAGTTFSCPECQAISPLHDHVERSWRHLDTCQYETRLHAKVPRVHCAEHGVRTVAVPWAVPHSRFTMLFERLAIAWLKEATPAAVARRRPDVGGGEWDCRPRGAARPRAPARRRRALPRDR